MAPIEREMRFRIACRNWPHIFIKGAELENNASGAVPVVLDYRGCQSPQPSLKLYVLGVET